MTQPSIGCPDMMVSCAQAKPSSYVQAVPEELVPLEYLYKVVDYPMVPSTPYLHHKLDRPQVLHHEIPQFNERKPDAQRKIESTLQSSVDRTTTVLIQDAVQKEIIVLEDTAEIDGLKATFGISEKTVNAKNAEFEDLDFILNGGHIIEKIHVPRRSTSYFHESFYYEFCRIQSPSPSYLYKSGYKLCMRVYLNRDSYTWPRKKDADDPLLPMIVENIELALKLKRQLLRERLPVSFKFVLTKEGYEDVEISDDDLSELRCQELKERLREFLWRLKALRQEKLLGGNSSSPLDVRWLEFQSLLLLAFGDVESNPGPLTSDELEKITNSILSEDDYFEVFTSVSTLCAKWYDFCLALGLPPSLLSSIRKDHTGESKGCLREGLISWLQQDYNINKHGPPSWMKLVEAVDHPDGGGNHALALKIAKDHKQSEVLAQNSKEDSFIAPTPAAVCSDPKKSQAMSTAFANMYRAISCLLQRSLQVEELKDHLQLLCHPQSFRQLCVDPRVYEGATSTKDILKKLCPEYINPAELFILEGIVETFGSRQCKKLLRGFQDEFC